MLQRVSDRPRASLGDFPPNIRREIEHVTLDVVEGAVERQRLLGDGTAVVDPQLVELASRVRRAASFRDAEVEVGLVAAEVVRRAQRERALLILIVLARASVWGGAKVDLLIPKSIVTHCVRLAIELGRPSS